MKTTTQPIGTATTYITLPEDVCNAIQSDIAEIKAYMLRHPHTGTASEKKEYVTPKQLSDITGYSPAAISNLAKGARAAGVQFIGTPGKHRIHKAQFLQYMEQINHSHPTRKA